MKILRWVIGAAAAVYALFSLWPLGSIIAYKLGRLDPVPAEMQRMLPLMDAMQWWHLGIWAVIVAALLIAAWRLFTGGRAALWLLIALGADVAMWLLSRQSPAYAQVFTPDELMMDYYIVGGMALAVVLVWLTERRKPG